MSRESKLVKNTLIIALGNICTKFISFFMLPLYTAVLSTSEYGTVDMINVLVSFAVIILTFQLELGLFRYLVEVRDNTEKQIEYITTVIIFSAVVNILFIVPYVAIMKMLNYQYIAPVCCMILESVMFAFLQQIPRGIGNNTLYSVGSTINGSLNVLLNVIFIAILRWRVEGLLFASIISHAIASLYLIFKIKIWKYIKFEKYSNDALKKLIKYSFPLIPSVLGWWIISASDKLVINAFLGVAANGIYSVAYKFPSVFSMVTNIFQLSWTESIAENINSSDSTSFAQSIMNKTIRLYSASNIGLIAVMPFFFPILVSEKFKDAYWYIPILMTGAFFHSVANLYGSLYTALKKTKEIAKTTLLGAGINLITNIALVKWVGIYAAAISTVLAYVIVAIVRHKDVIKDIKIIYEKKYLIMEFLVYMLVFSSYYIGNIVVKICTLLLIIPYCAFQNKELIMSLIASLVKRSSNKK